MRGRDLIRQGLAWAASVEANAVGRARAFVETEEAISSIATVCPEGRREVAIMVRDWAKGLHTAERDLALALRDRVAAGASLREAIWAEAIWRHSPLRGMTPVEVLGWLDRRR